MNLSPPPSDLPQYIVWKSVPVPGAKPLKVPVNYMTGLKCSAHDSENWTDYATALRQMSFVGGAGVGFVLTPADPHVCIDLDACLQSDGTWSPFAQDIINRFPGAAIELSHSGKGLHLWGQATAPLNHRTRSKDVPGLEMYSVGRFIALGPQFFSGDPGLNITESFAHTLAAYLPGETVDTGAWTDEPDPAWSGPEDDAELVTKMLNSKGSMAAVFGDGATVRDLWENNVAVLSGAYQSESGGDFNHSSADMALASHLAFWTGKNCERMDRLFRQSGLMREKWDRDGYKVGTLTRAAAGCTSVYSGVRKTPEQPPESTALDDLLPDQIKATPYIWMDPATIPRRKWLYGHCIIRGFTSLVIAPGGAGKSALLITDALALTTNRNLVGTPVYGRALKVWVWNLEDPMDELNRRIAAACLHHGISSDNLDDRLFVDSGRDKGLCIAKQGRNGHEVLKPIVSALVEELRTREIDVLIVDPFVSSHSVSENDNTAMDAVAKAWGRVADQANCAVVLVHHVRKLGGEQASADSARGASALVAAARSVRVVAPMKSTEAEDAGLDTHKGYFKVFDGKNNLAPAEEEATWFHMASVALPNGDNVGVVEAWKWPNAFQDVTTDDLQSVKHAVAGKGYRASSQAQNWVGFAVGKVLGIDATQKPDKKRVSLLLKTWIKNGALKKVEMRDERGKLRPCIDVGKQLE